MDGDMPVSGLSVESKTGGPVVVSSGEDLQTGFRCKCTYVSIRYVTYL